MALFAAAMVHAMTDVVLLWVQTGLLLALVLGGLGIEERMLDLK